ncbi:hypothetical protein TNIN_159421 [Trichonephila inaurata madagascariensis]|uniref:Uncharacterized protein n=1 Tax=Trichonephila inaurata madagascariensis TaxID=2747483 RepID=A0A8X6WMS3_9ARAC|nr:hypothetical protein TNIN_159421 [Trichonephila inaurata madagascariensis]
MADNIIASIAPFAVVLVIIGCFVYCCYKCCKCCSCCCKKEQAGPIIVDSQVIQPLSPAVQHIPPLQMGNKAFGPQPYPPNIMQPPMNYYPQQPLPPMPPIGNQPSYPNVTYNPLVPPHCPLPPIPTNLPPAETVPQTEALTRQPEYNPSYVPSAPPP